MNRLARHMEFEEQEEAIMLNFSHHAQRRSAQRSISSEHVRLALAWGCPIRQQGGREVYHLGYREAKGARKTGVPIPERAIGVAVVLSDDGTVVTVVRSHDRRRLFTHGNRSRTYRRRGGVQ